MSTACDLAAQSMGTGVSAALTAVDCIASGMSEQAFNRLFGTEGQLAFALTLLLGLYVGFFGISLMLGRANLSVRALLPKMMTLGLVLTFATSFVAFSTIFYNIFIGGPDQIAGVLTGTEGSATATFAQKIDVVFQAIQKASGDTKDISAFSPPGMMWLGAMLLLLGTVGLLVTARIGLALLLAVGPIFVVMALFEGTRGLFTGWLKGLVLLALAPLFAVLGGSIMLEMAVPVLAALVKVPGQIDQQAAMAFFLIGAVHVALMFLSLKVASTMVAGWQVFGLVPDKDRGRFADGPRALTPAGAAAAVSTTPRSTNIAPATAAMAARSVDIAPAQLVVAANDTGPSSGARETRVYATGGGGSTQVTPLNPATSRTRGIGNRFRSAGSAAPAPKPAATTPPETYQ